MKLQKLNNWGYSLDTGVPVPLRCRDWQQKAYERVLSHITGSPNPRPSLVRAIMGSGKSILLAQTVASMDLDDNECIVVTTPTQKLVRQLFSTIRDRVEGDEFLLTPKVGMYYALKKDFNAPIIVTCLPSAPELAEILVNRIHKKCALMMIDECHRSENESIKTAHGCLAPAITFGLSIGPDACILVKHPDSIIRHHTIGEFCDSFSIEDGKFHYMEDSYQVRSFDGSRFKWTPLSAVFRHKLADKKSFRIKTQYGRCLSVTEDHSVYVWNGSSVIEKNGSDLNIGDKLILERSVDLDGNAITEFDISEACKNDSKMKVSNGIIKPSQGKGFWCKTRIPVQKLAYMIGFFIGNGWVRGEKARPTFKDETLFNPRMGFCMHEEKYERFLKMIDPLHEYAEFTVKIRKQGLSKAIEINVSNKYLCLFFDTFCDEARKKFIPDFLFNLSQEDTWMVIQGLMDSDGCIRNIDRNRSRMVYTTSSKKLTDGLLSLLSRVGIIGSVSKRNSDDKLGGIINGRQIVGSGECYTIGVSGYETRHREKHSEKCGTRAENLPFGGSIVKIVSIEQDSPEYVYDLSVKSKKWQSFVANGLLVHNTATPFLAKEDAGLTLFQEILYDYGPKEAIADKVVVPWRIINWQGGEAELDAACLEMCKSAVGPGMFNAVSIKDAEEFAEGLTTNGFPSMAVHSKLKDTDVDARIHLLKTGKIRSIVHVNMLAEGVDLPWLRWLCMRRPVSSRVRFAQEVGRVLRAYKDKLTGEEKTEAVIYDPHDLFGSLKLSYEAVLGGEYLNDKEKPEEDPIKEMQRALEQQMFICTQELVGAKADKRPLNMGPLASYLRELVNAFDVCGLCDRTLTPGSWRSQGISAKQDVAIGNLGWTITHRSVPKTHQRCLDILSKERRSLSKGLAADLMTVMMTIGDKKKWPDFKSLDTSANENLKKRDEAATRVPEFNKGVPLKPQSQQQLTPKQKQDKIQGKLFQ